MWKIYKKKEKIPYNNNITLKLIQITIAQKTLSISSSNNLKRSMQRSFNNIISTAVSI